MFCPDSEELQDLSKHSENGMSLVDKMSLWGQKSDVDGFILGTSDLFEGVPDEEDQDVNPTEVLRYNKAIFSSGAYQWLIASLLRESHFHWDESHSRVMVDEIRQKILEKLPTGTISKKRGPKVYKVGFRLPWESLELRLKSEGSKRGISPGRAIHDTVVLTCSSTDQIQATTIKQYLKQTWASGGAELLNVLCVVIDSPPGRSFSGKTPDQLDCTRVCTPNQEQFTYQTTRKLGRC